MKHDHRRKLPSSVASGRYKFQVGNHEGFLHVGFYAETWEVGEIFVKLSKTGSTLLGFVDSFCILVSIGLQYGVPLETLVSKFSSVNFEPNGPVMHDEHVKRCWSIPDYIVNKVSFLQEVAQKRQGIPGVTLASRELASEQEDTSFDGLEPVTVMIGKVRAPALDKTPTEFVGRPCPDCGSLEVHIEGRCLMCYTCGYEEGTCFST